MTIRAACAVLVVTGALCTLAGCASSPPSDEGIRIGDETLTQFKAGVTTEAWLVAILGPPTSWAPVDGVENTKVFRYATAERSGGGVASLFTGSGRQNTAITYFIITEGVVTRYWADRAKEHTLLGKPVEQESGTKNENAG